MTRNIDELSNLTTQKAEPPEEYFGKMDLNEEQVEKRLQYTKKANELFDVILILLLTMNERGETNFFYAKNLLESWMLSLVAEFTTPDDYLIDYVSDAVYNFVETTNNHIDNPWYTSSDRALYNAENGANDVLNYTEYKEAIEEGKTEKRWITETDNRVRKSHKAVTKKPIPIKDYFRVGMAKMRFPKDYELADAFPEELINCRCTIEYLPKDEKDNKELASKEEGTKGVDDKSTMVRWSKVYNPGYGQKISKIEPDREIASVIKVKAREMLRHRSGSNYYEDMTYIDSLNVKNTLTQKNYNVPRKVEPTEEMKDLLINSPEKTIISIHNHAGNSIPSLADVVAAKSYKYGVIACHNGDLYKYTVKNLNEPLYAAAEAKADVFEYTDEVISTFIKEAKVAGVEIEAFRWK